MYREADSVTGFWSASILSMPKDNFTVGFEATAWLVVMFATGAETCLPLSLDIFSAFFFFFFFFSFFLSCFHDTNWIPESPDLSRSRDVRRGVSTGVSPLISSTVIGRQYSLFTHNLFPRCPRHGTTLGEDFSRAPENYGNEAGPLACQSPEIHLHL